MDDLLNNLASLFADPSKNSDPENLLNQFLDLLEQGHVRCVNRNHDGWIVDERVKKGILLAFRHGQAEKKMAGPFSYIDKHNLWPRQFDVNDNVRILPGSFIRRGAYVGRNVILMPPSYVNIGAVVDDETLIDSHALVGSCAYVGKRVHVSAGVQIGGVLEPIQNAPVIIDDDVLLGGNSGLYEGVRVGQKAVIGAGVILTASSKIFDVVSDQIITADDKGVLSIPNNAVVVLGSRKISGKLANDFGLSLQTPIIIKYRDQKTDAKTELEQALRI